MRVKDVMRACEKLAPKKLAVEGDNIGLIIGDAREKVSGILVALDATHEAIDFAVKENCSLLVVHHPPIFSHIKKIDYAGAQGGLIKRIVENGISVFAMHTNLDSAPKGLNHEVAKILGLKKIRPVKHDDITYSMGELNKKTNARGLAVLVKKNLKLKSVRFYGNRKEIRQVAVCTGSGSDFLAHAASRGAQALVTGEVRHHNTLECGPLGTVLVEAGHLGTERPVIQIVTRHLVMHLKKFLAKSAKSIRIIGFNIEEDYESV